MKTRRGRIVKKSCLLLYRFPKLVGVDDALLNVVLERLDENPLLGRPEELLLAALESDDALGGTIGGQPQARPSPARLPDCSGIPASYLSRLTVNGFRGIGPVATLVFAPGPGLTLVVGRNGSGKSSFAEALELLITGRIKRWDDRSAIWRDGWRNLHSTGDPYIEVEVQLEGSTGVTLRRWWNAGNDFERAATATPVHKGGVKVAR